MSTAQTVLQVDSVTKSFSARSMLNPLNVRRIPAVDGVSLSIGTAETVAVVGESGSGKSTLGRLVLKLLKPDAGRIALVGREIHNLSDGAFRPLRRHVQMVFQNPLTSFDPFYTIGASILETMSLRSNGQVGEQQVSQLLHEVGLAPRFARLRPRTVSGGELQRAALARALAPYPELVVLDEPTSALDMSIQGQVLSLLRELQQGRGLSYLLATHDLRVVQMVAHRVVVLYLGQVMETAPTAELFSRPLHPYTLGLFYARDLAGRSEASDRKYRIRGALSYPPAGYAGCKLVARCPLAMERCKEPQELVMVRPGHSVRCWRAAAGETSGGLANGSN
jgi:oligopeptide/dipeptide ABC transporter ATP-binding protein